MREGWERRTSFESRGIRGDGGERRGMGGLVGEERDGWPGGRGRE